MGCSQSNGALGCSNSKQKKNQVQSKADLSDAPVTTRDPETLAADKAQDAAQLSPTRKMTDNEIKLKKQASSGTLLVAEQKGKQVVIDLSASSEQLEKYVEEMEKIDSSKRKNEGNGEESDNDPKSREAAANNSIEQKGTKAEDDKKVGDGESNQLNRCYTKQFSFAILCTLISNKI